MAITKATVWLHTEKCNAFWKMKRQKQSLFLNNKSLVTWLAAERVNGKLVSGKIRYISTTPLPVRPDHVTHPRHSGRILSNPFEPKTFFSFFVMSNSNPYIFELKSSTSYTNAPSVHVNLWSTAHYIYFLLVNPTRLSSMFFWPSNQLIQMVI